MIKPLVKYFMKRSLKESDRQPSRVTGNHIRDVAIVAIYRPDQNFAYIEQFVKDWRTRGMRRVELFLYFPNKKLRESFKGDVKAVTFGKRDFSFAGKAKQPELVAALHQDYDVLIDLSRGNAFSCDVVISKVRAKWKVGESDQAREYLLDLMIDIKGDPDIRKLMHHMDHYILNLNTSNAA